MFIKIAFNAAKVHRKRVRQEKTGDNICAIGPGRGEDDMGLGKFLLVFFDR